jgi:hypothetical protein
MNNLIEIFEDLLRCSDTINYIPAVVFDIDGTIIQDGYSYFDKSNLIDSIYGFYQYLQKRGDIRIFVITARGYKKFESKDDPYYLEVLKMLKGINCHPDKLDLWDYNKYADVTIYKTEKRRELFQKHNILMSLGDNDWDYGKFGGLGVHIYNDGEKIDIIL